MPSKKRDWKIRITDILECIARIQKYTLGFGVDEFESDNKLLTLYCGIWKL